MRKLIILVMAAALMLVPVAAMGAIHHWTGDYAATPMLGPMSTTIYFSDPLVKMDTWFTITPQAKSVEFAGVQGDDFTLLGGEYYLNDQTFLEFVRYDGLNMLSGSYLFKNNVFVGMQYMSDSADATIFSVGYRWGWGEEGYAAISWDYVSTTSTSDTLGYEINGAYYGESYKLSGQIYLVDSAEQTIIDLGFNYQFTDTLVGGLSFWQYGDLFTLFGGGITWAPEFMILDAQFLINDEADGSMTLLSAMFNASDKLSLGIQSISESDGEINIYLKGKYALKSGAFIKSALLLGNDDHDAYFFLGYQKDLK